jgi:TolB-like protein
MDKSGTSHIAKALGSSKGARHSELARGFRLAEWLVRPEFCTLTTAGRTEQIEPKVIAVLLCLAQHAPQVVTREQFIREVWDGRTVTDEVLSRSISLLRTHLGDDTHAPRFIKTIPRIGYSLIATVERLEVPPQAGGPTSEPDLQAEPAPSQAAPAPIRLAVLPFVNVSGEPDKDYFVEGLADELIASLSRVDGLHVVARTSAQRFRNRDTDVREIGRLLGATHLVEGNVHSDGQRLRVGVQLVNASTGHDMWAETYDRGLKDVLALQTDIASAIMQSLARKLPATFSAGLRPPTWNLEAYQSYLRGQQQLKRRGAAAIRSSIDLFSEAVALDPKFASAQIALAYAYTLLPSYTPVDATLMYSNADSALAAAARDPELSAGTAGVRAVLEVRRNRWIAAEHAFRTALDANPANSEVRQWYSQLLGAVGQLRAALQEAQHALANDPLSPILNFRLAVAHLWNDQDADAERQFAVARELGLEPSVTPEAFTMLLVRQRRFDDVMNAFIDTQRSRRQSDEWVSAVVVAIRDQRPDPHVASVIERAFAAGQMGWVAYVGTLVLTGHHERALQSLLTRSEVSPSDLEFLFIREASAARRHADFGRLIVQLHMDDYWDRFGWPQACMRTGDSIRCE